MKIIYKFRCLLLLASMFVLNSASLEAANAYSLIDYGFDLSFGPVDLRFLDDTEEDSIPKTSLIKAPRLVGIYNTLVSKVGKCKDLRPVVLQILETEITDQDAREQFQNTLLQAFDLDVDAINLRYGYANNLFLLGGKIAPNPKENVTRLSNYEHNLAFFAYMLSHIFNIKKWGKKGESTALYRLYVHFTAHNLPEHAAAMSQIMKDTNDLAWIFHGVQNGLQVDSLENLKARIDGLVIHFFKEAALNIFREIKDVKRRKRNSGLNSQSRQLMQSKKITGKAQLPKTSFLSTNPFGELSDEE